MSDLHEFLDRGVAGATDVDLVKGVWRTARVRRRNRRLGAGAAVAAVAAGAVVISQWGGSGAVPEDLAPAADTVATSAPTTPVATSAPTAPVVDTLEANQRFLDGIRASGLAFDYEPMESPEWAVSGGRQVLVGTVEEVRASGADFVVTVVVQQAIPDVHVAERVDAVLQSGPAHDLTSADLDAVGGSVLLALPDQPLPADPPEEVLPYVDGFWLEVPDGVGNPYTDYEQMPQAWPAVASVEELAVVLSEAEDAAQSDVTQLPIECSASWQNPPPLNSTGLSPAALDTANHLIGLAATCDQEGLIDRAIANGTTVAVSEGDVSEQLATPDDSGAYVRLESTMSRPATRDGDLHVFELEGWQVVIDDNGRWVEFSSH